MATDKMPKKHTNQVGGLPVLKQGLLEEWNEVTLPRNSLGFELRKSVERALCDKGYFSFISRKLALEEKNLAKQPSHHITQ